MLGDLIHADDRDAVLFGEELEERQARRRAVVVQHLADHRDRRQPGETRQVDRGLGVPAPFEHAALTGAEREDVTGPDELVGVRRGVEEPAHGVGPVGGADPAAGLPVVDRDRERRVAAGGSGRHHRWDVEPVQVLGRGGHAHEPARPAEHEVDRFRRDPLRRHREVTLVLAVLVVGDEDHLAATDPTQGLVDARELHRVSSRPCGPGRKAPLRWRGTGVVIGRPASLMW